MVDAKKVDPSKEGIREARKRLGLTQTELAKSLGYSRNYITLLETGARPVSAQVVAQVAAMLTEVDNRGPAHVRESPAPYADTACRIPANCDLPARLDSMQSDINALRERMDTLLGLLGAPLRQAIARDLKPTDEKMAG